VPDLTPAADRYISAMLRRDDRVPPEALDGVPEDERGELLRQYFIAHQGEFPVRYEDGVLAIDPSAMPSATVDPAPVRPDPAASIPGPQPVAPAAYPVAAAMPGVYPGPGESKALLDSKPAAGPIARWLYLLPLMFGFVGGVVGWLVVRDENPRGGRNLMLVGVVVSVLTACLSFAMAGAVSSTLRGVSSNSTSWPAAGAASSRPAMYYFGTST
jgi:hypothetical protein